VGETVSSSISSRYKLLTDGIEASGHTQMPKPRTGAYPETLEYMQLSLFSDLTEAPPVDNLEKESLNAGNGQPNADRTQDSEALEQISTQNGRSADGTGSTPTSGLRGSGTNGQPAVRIDGGEKDGLPDGLGIGDEGMGISTRRGGPTSIVVRSRDSRPEPTLASDLRITDAHAVGKGSVKEKAQANLAAIRTLKRIEAENRPATAEEKAILVKYTGWGAMPGAFEPQLSREWQTVAKELQEILNPEEYASARASTPNAHYTSPDIIRAIWQAMERFGLKPGGHVLEPSMGVGHFFGLMPESLHPGTRRTGVELDSVTARIAAKVYPDSNIQAKGLEETPLPNNFFDAAVGNIPFGNYPVFDPAYRRSPQLTRSIHDYFLAKCLDVVRPGGLIALITSRYTMDKQDFAVRRHLAEGAELLGAIRLPNTTFRANAGTDVKTDILFLQKHSHDVEHRGEKWADVTPFNTPVVRSRLMNTSSGIPDEHPICKVHQSAGTPDNVPRGCRCTDSRYAEASAARAGKRTASN
jgi:hypothetical protein